MVNESIHIKTDCTILSQNQKEHEWVINKI